MRFLYNSICLMVWWGGIFCFFFYFCLFLFLFYLTVDGSGIMKDCSGRGKSHKNDARRRRTNAKKERKGYLLLYEQVHSTHYTTPTELYIDGSY